MIALNKKPIKINSNKKKLVTLLIIKWIRKINRNKI